jgi:circadian clock protein KaiC
MGIMIERCASGISGFDELCQGGFVRNSENVLIGGAGSGKTTFMLQFLWNGATKYNENGLYCSFEPDIIETLQDGMTFGWDFAKLNELNKVKFLKFSPKTSINDLKSELTKLISRFNIRRVCFDPISVLALNNNDEGKVREEFFDLASLLKRLKVTSIIAEEMVEGKKEPNTEIMKFLADSVTYLNEEGLNNASERSIRILKMRRTKHHRPITGMNITDTGIQVIAPKTIVPAKPATQTAPAQNAVAPRPIQIPAPITAPSPMPLRVPSPVSTMSSNSTQPQTGSAPPKY